MLLPQSNCSFVRCCCFQIHAGSALRGGFPLGGLKKQRTNGSAAAGLENIERDDWCKSAYAFSKNEASTLFGICGAGNFRDDAVRAFGLQINFHLAASVGN